MHIQAGSPIKSCCQLAAYVTCKKQTEANIQTNLVANNTSLTKAVERVEVILYIDIVKESDVV